MDELRYLARAGLALLCLAALSACKLEITVPDGGSVSSQSGAYLCRENDRCSIDVVDLFFDETFVAQPHEGYRFVGWRSRNGGLCGGSDGDCPLSTGGFLGNPALLALLESDETFFLEPEFHLENSGPLFNLRYCEILLPTLEDSVLRVDVYGTQGVNLCPQKLWDAIDPEQVAEQFNAVTAIMNGPRYWVLDLITLSSDAPEGALPTNAGGIALFGDLEMRLITTVEPNPALLQVEGIGDSGEGYQVIKVDRFTRFLFIAGRRVYELINPDGQRFMMQSYTQLALPDQGLADLRTLGRRLNLPEGWRFETRILRENFILESVGGIAEVLTDNFGNTYQRVIP